MVIESYSGATEKRPRVQDTHPDATHSTPKSENARSPCKEVKNIRTNQPKS